MLNSFICQKISEVTGLKDSSGLDGQRMDVERLMNHEACSFGTAATGVAMTATGNCGPYGHCKSPSQLESQLKVLLTGNTAHSLSLTDILDGHDHLCGSNVEYSSSCFYPLGRKYIVVGRLQVAHRILSTDDINYYSRVLNDD
jgi:hypothetical protein